VHNERWEGMLKAWAFFSLNRKFALYI
jgi:hypothetical protein